MRKWLCSFLILIPLVDVAQARVLNLGSESFAPYIRGEYQISALDKTPFSESSGTGNSYSLGHTSEANYEFGFVYAIKQISLRFGFEVLKPPALKDIKATDAAGTELFLVSNDISGYVPKIALDVNIKQWPQSRIFLNAAYGLATVTVQNSYGFTADGLVAYPALADFREETKGSGTLMEYSIGWEFLAFDTTTLVLDVGCRYLKIDSLNHNLAVTSFQGAVAKGDKALTDAGTDRKLDLSGYFASVQFRFWVF